MSGQPTIDGLLAEARAAGIERIDAQRLLEQQLGRPRSWLLAHGDETLPGHQAAQARAGWARLAAGEPLAYLTGEAGFHGLTLKVSADVLVPRADTEVLVAWALERLTDAGAHPTVLDLGTGSGAVALAVAHDAPSAIVTATDTSPQALAIARANGEQLALPVQWLEGDWWSPVTGRRFDLVVSNPPYIAGADPHLPNLRHEPSLALTPGGDGLDAIRRIAEGAQAHLRPGGWLLLEHGYDQADAVRTLLAAAGLAEVSSRRDLAGHWRCTGARRPPAAGTPSAA